MNGEVREADEEVHRRYREPRPVRQERCLEDRDDEPDLEEPPRARGHRGEAFEQADQQQRQRERHHGAGEVHEERLIGPRRAEDESDHTDASECAEEERCIDVGTGVATHRAHSDEHEQADDPNVRRVGQEPLQVHASPGRLVMARGRVSGVLAVLRSTRSSDPRLVWRCNAVGGSCDARSTRPLAYRGL